MKKYIISIDQGTSSTKVLLFDENRMIINRINSYHKQHHPAPDMVEQDGSEIFGLTLDAIRQTVQLAGGVESIAAISISNQTGASLVWDKNTGEPIYNIIGWQCSRGSEFIKNLSDTDKAFFESIGYTPSAHSIPMRLLWMHKYLPEFTAQAKLGNLMFGTIDSWLVYKLTGGRVHACNATNASITRLFDIKNHVWKRDFLSYLNIQEVMMPEVLADDGDFGTAAIDDIAGIPITGVMGDSAAALFGQCCFHPGDIKITYGTGASMLVNLGSQPLPASSGVSMYIGWQQGGNFTYVWEGTVIYAGAVTNWIMNDLELVKNVEELNILAESVPDSCNVYFVPAFTGLAAPYFDEDARACIVGITPATKRAHIARAALESNAFQIRDILETLSGSLKILNSGFILADGGGSNSHFLMQFQADILNMPVKCTAIKDSSALGAACMAGLAVGLWPSKEFLSGSIPSGTQYIPQMSVQQRDALYAGWKQAIKQALHHNK